MESFFGAKKRRKDEYLKKKEEKQKKAIKEFKKDAKEKRLDQIKRYQELIKQNDQKQYEIIKLEKLKKKELVVNQNDQKIQILTEFFNFIIYILYQIFKQSLLLQQKNIIQKMINQNTIQFQSFWDKVEIKIKIWVHLVMFELLQNQTCNNFLYYLLMFIENIQILYFSIYYIGNQYLWNTKILKAFQQMIQFFQFNYFFFTSTYQNGLIILYVSSSITLIFCILLIITSKKIINNEKNTSVVVSYLVSILTLFGLLIINILTLPIINTYIVYIICNNDLSIHIEYPCYSGVYYIHLTFAIICLIFQLIVSFLFMFFFIDLNPSSQLPFASPQSLMPLLKFFIKLILPFYVTIDIDGSYFKQFIIIINIIYLFILLQRYKTLAYYNKNVQQFAVYCECLLFWVTFCCVLVIYLDEGTTNDISFIFMIIGYPFIGLFYNQIIYNRNYFLLKQNVTDFKKDQDAEMYIFIIIDLIKNIEITEKRILLEGILKLHYKQCKKDICHCRLLLIDETKNDNMPLLLKTWYLFVKFMIEDCLKVDYIYFILSFNMKNLKIDLKHCMKVWSVMIQNQVCKKNSLYLDLIHKLKMKQRIQIKKKEIVQIQMQIKQLCFRKNFSNFKYLLRQVFYYIQIFGNNYKMKIHKFQKLQDIKQNHLQIKLLNYLKSQGQYIQIIQNPKKYMETFQKIQQMIKLKVKRFQIQQNIQEIHTVCQELFKTPINLNMAKILMQQLLLFQEIIIKWEQQQMQIMKLQEYQDGLNKKFYNKIYLSQCLKYMPKYTILLYLIIQKLHNKNLLDQKEQYQLKIKINIQYHVLQLQKYFLIYQKELLLLDFQKICNNKINLQLEVLLIKIQMKIFITQYIELILTLFKELHNLVINHQGYQHLQCMEIVKIILNLQQIQYAQNQKIQKQANYQKIQKVQFQILIHRQFNKKFQLIKMIQKKKILKIVNTFIYHHNNMKIKILSKQKNKIQKNKSQNEYSQTLKI
ncbi:hypothetical protein IMG5_001250 [Ichthyophthirius multifiliis]|uniref:Transmembrane protein n=1 Tax=Ichthyophthirius multifiliis TaxID=5932 RepID=G0QIR7_ICHMU|nr:hypothetical protein IMG5_001250 [Ichthyophthirius multifiliis]EGR34896.1 hypothetical protein IMG5_001250 [Ichthyophthirius multifiliis]|eukprot:XP_004040200.1 hypothetical protein IMG5_001250 [Ichthyophthirius multifiliis]